MSWVNSVLRQFLPNGLSSFSAAGLFFLRAPFSLPSLLRARGKRKTRDLYSSPAVLYSLRARDEPKNRLTLRKSRSGRFQSQARLFSFVLLFLRDAREWETEGLEREPVTEGKTQEKDVTGYRFLSPTSVSFFFWTSGSFPSCKRARKKERKETLKRERKRR